jgi:SAM-dependent MidA family methyltransferase
MDDLKKKIITRIREKGPVTFEQFMEMALYDPEYGYYTKKEKIVGKEGDFYTSSHLHPVFGSMIGRQINEMWELMDKPGEFTIVEQGAGEGYVCRDMLNYLNGSEIYKALTYSIIEFNPALRDRQEELLAGYREKVRWAASLSDVGSFKGCIFSNELLDAFPVHIVQMDDELKELYVTVDGDNLKEELGRLSTDALSDFFRQSSIELRKGYRTEVNLKIREWLEEVNRVLEKGFILTVDYGYSARDYYADERDRGTLVCYYRHQLNEDPLRNIGEQDMTAHVDFSSVKTWADGLGIRSIGFCNQGAFLVAMGVDEEIQRLAASSDNYLFELARIKRLILPEGMGESHQVLIQTKDLSVKGLKGFSIRNKVRNL